jgi:hypothetical protein
VIARFWQWLSVPRLAAITDESLDIDRARLIIQSAKRVAEAYRGAAGSWPWYLELDRGVLPGS